MCLLYKSKYRKTAEVKKPIVLGGHLATVGRPAGRPSGYRRARSLFPFSGKEAMKTGMLLLEGRHAANHGAAVRLPSGDRRVRFP